MLKGHVFSKQLFENQIFALFINTFLDGANGISSNYANSMDLSYDGFTVTIDSGAVCIQGRFLEESTTTEITVDEDTAYCKLVIEIDLDQTNTTSELNQAYYKVLTDDSDYPELTQTDIVGNNAGIYQYELAKFTVSSDGIDNWEDTRTYLDFDSIYTYIKEQLNSLLKECKENFTEWADTQQTEFEEWFTNIKDVLDDDTAGNLLLLIEELQETISNMSNSGVIPVDPEDTTDINIWIET